MILQGVGHPVPYLGVLYANDPKKEGYMVYAPVLDLTTLFEVILPHAVCREKILRCLRCQQLSPKKISKGKKAGTRTFGGSGGGGGGVQIGTGRPPCGQANISAIGL